MCQGAILNFIRVLFENTDSCLELCRVIKLMIMRSKVQLLFLALVMVSCSKENVPDHGINYSYGRGLAHEQIVLGKRLENPYKTENVTKALQSLYPTKADRVEVKPTDLYVRFLPSSKEQCDCLEDLGLDLIDHPLDFDIAVEGDWYHDPEVPDNNMTWQYAVVPVGFQFPEDIEYELIDECYIINSSGTRSSDGIDWEAVEREAYRITGNEERLEDLTTKASNKVTPTGRITIVDSKANGGKPFGVAGVKVSCNSFVKFASTYTDRDGYYTMPKSFSANLRYRLVFQNKKGFSIGVNLILVPASVSTLGKSGPSGVNMTVTNTSDGKLFRRCVVNNAAYDYYSRCSNTDLNLTLPPSDLRIWIFKNLEASSAVMLHHNTILNDDLIAGYLGNYAVLIKTLLPDITIGAKGRNDYASLYSATCHELAHASHFSKVDIGYWNSYISYIVRSFLLSGGKTYGDGSGDGAGLCEVGEMWAYYLESRMYKDRYGGSMPSFGTSFWFYPQIFRYLDERGIKPSQILSVLDNRTVSRQTLKQNLTDAYPSRRMIIEQVFSRY